MNKLSLVAGLALLSFLAGSPSLYAQRDAKVPDPDPEIERKSFQVADGFEVNLFAADPLLAKPIQMNFDAGRPALGRLPARPIRRSSRARRPTTRSSSSKTPRAPARPTRSPSSPTACSSPPASSRATAASTSPTAPTCCTSQDTKGDGKADKRRVVLSGFGTEDTHHIVHTLRWGPDGMLYFNQSIYIHSHIETPHGVRRLNGGGIWQFRPETMQLEVFLRGFWNPWGHHFDRWGQSFVTDGAGGEGINYGLPGAYYVFATPSPRASWPASIPAARSTAAWRSSAAGTCPTTGRATSSPTTSAAIASAASSSREDGAGYASREKPELIKTNHPAFRPIDVKMGPDGAIYIADWYNPIIQHGEVDFRDPRRDLTHGRIWRVTARAGRWSSGRQLVEAKVEDLLEALKAPEDWTRQQAKRVLKERGAKEVLPALETWVAKLDVEGRGPRAPPARSTVDVSVARRGRAEAARHVAAARRTAASAPRRCASSARGTTA